MTVAVIGATGTVGSRIVRRLEARDVDVVAVSRAHGVDLISGDGLAEALGGVETVVDASNAFPPDDAADLREVLVRATRNVVAACTTAGVARLVLVSIAGVEDLAFDAFPYYLAKRDQERVVGDAPLDSTVLKTTQWFEFGTNPAAVTFHDDGVEVQDWLVQPIAADTVAEVVAAEAVTASGRAVRVLAGPEPVRLPELTRRTLHHRGDRRPVRVVEAALPQLTQGVLLAPAGAEILGPRLDDWLTDHA